MQNILTTQFKAYILNFVQSITIAIAISLFLFFFVVVPSQVEGSSMEPNFFTGERLYTDRLPHWFNGSIVGSVLNLDYKRGDVVVVEKPGMKPLIKRIIGLPGETIEIIDNYFYINGNLLEEPYLDNTIQTKGGSFLKEGVPLTIPDNNFFIAGDNRGVSNDSRFFGFIKTDWLVGKPFLRIWPLERTRTF